MNSYQKNVALGLIVIIAVLAFGAGTLWLRGKSVGHSDLEVVYNDIGNLKDGAPVRISGAPVGRVTDIVFLAPGHVAVSVKFTEKIALTKNAKAAITSVGMLGDEVVTLDPGSGPPLASGDTIQGTIAPGVFDKAADIADQAAKTLTRVNAMLDTQVIVDLRHTLVSTRQLMAYLADEQRGPVSQLTPTMLALQKTSARLDTTLASLDLKQLQARLDTTLRSASSATDRLASMSAHADSLVLQVQHSNGTIGRLMNDNGLYDDLRKTMQSITDLLNEIKKNPGKIGVTVRIP